MGNQRQVDWIASHQEQIQGPILELGSEYGNFVTRVGGILREKFAGLPYTGTALAPGKGVDVLCDFTNEAEVRERLGQGAFQTVFCLTVLEHCVQPFFVAENLTKVLAPGGLLFLSVPFVWPLHGLPHDYWRFTLGAVRVLFPALTVLESWDMARVCRPPLLDPNMPSNRQPAMPLTLLNVLLKK